MSSSPSDSSSLQDNTADAEEQPPAPVPAAPNSSATQSPATSPSERVAIDFPSAIADPDAWQANLNPADKAELAALLQNSPDPQGRVRRILSIGYAADVTGSSPYDVSHQWDGFGRSQFSTHPRGLGMMTPVKNDAEFFTGLQAKVRNEIAESDLLQNGPGSLESMVRSAGSERRDYTQTFGEWQRQNLDANGYNPARAGEYYALTRPHYDDALGRSRLAAAANAARVVQLANSPGPQGMMTADGNVHTPGNGLSGAFAPAQPAFTVPGDPPTSGSADPGTATAPHLDPVAALGLPGSSPPPPDKEQILPGQVFGPPRMDDTPSTPGTLSGPMPVMPHVDGDAFQKMLDSPEFGEVVKKNFPHTLASFTGDMATEWDGDPFAYGPPNAPGRDDLSNAYDIPNKNNPDEPHYLQRRWFGVLTTNREDPFSDPVVQGPKDLNPGGYFSQLSFHADWTKRHDYDPKMPAKEDRAANTDAVKAATDVAERRKNAEMLPNFFPNADKTNFIAVQREGTDKHPIYSDGKPGDLVTVVDNYTGRYVHGIVGDIRHNPRGEASVAFSRQFGLGTEGSDDPKRFSYFVYKGSAGTKADETNWPMTNDQIHEHAERYRQMTPEVQTAIDAGRARYAATHSSPPPNEAASFATAQQNNDDFGRLAADGPQGIPGWRTPPGPPPPLAIPRPQADGKEKQKAPPKAPDSVPAKAVPASAAPPASTGLRRIFKL